MFTIDFLLIELYISKCVLTILVNDKIYSFLLLSNFKSIVKNKSDFNFKNLKIVINNLIIESLIE